MDEMDLRKLYYTDIDAYQKAYHKRFHADSTIHLDFMIGENQAFFTQSNRVIQLMYNILRLDTKIQRLFLQLPEAAIAQYSKKCLIDEIVISNDLEGVRSTRKEINDVLSTLETQSNRKNKQLRFVGMVKKYQMLMGDESIPLQTCEEVRRLYDDLVLDEVVAEDKQNRPDGLIFRKDQAEVVSATQKVIHTGVVPEKKVIQMVSSAMTFLNDESIEALYRISVFHYLLEYIHPFYDGNGRLGRFIISYYLSKVLNKFWAYRLSQTIKENVSAYYKAFSTCNDFRNMGEVTPFAIMMLEMIEKSGCALQEALGQKLIVLNRYREYVKSKGLTVTADMRALYDALIQASLFSEQGVSIKELERCLGVKYATVKKKLADVEAQFPLREEKHGKLNYYQLDIQRMDQFVVQSFVAVSE